MVENILEANKETNKGPTLSTTGQYGCASVEDVLTNGPYGKLPSADSTTLKTDSNMNGVEDSLDKSSNNIDALTRPKTSTDIIHDNSNIASVKSTSDAPNNINNSKTSSENITQSEFDKNQTLTNITSAAENISKPDAGNSTNKTVEPFWSCAKYNITEQNVIILKDKNSLIWWLDELNKTMGCAVVLFYAKWCYFSANLAPAYNAVGRAFSGIPILAIDAYTHYG